MVDHLFRQQAGRMVATLTRIFGPAHLGLAEDVVQEALAAALRTWPFSGVPDNPAAWIVRAARNRALDVLRRERSLAGKESAIEQALGPPVQAPEAATVFATEIADDTLRLMFICCHPAVPSEGRVALTLKTIGGFGTAEIARAFLQREATVAQRLVRAKRRIRERELPFRMPAPAELARRLGSVMGVLYLIFNEGHSAHRGDSLIRRDLCVEAIRLARLLAENPRTARPEVHALAALFCFQAARLPARISPGGELLALEEQDRTLWDPELIASGLRHFEQAATGKRLSTYHLEAEIASCHTLAASYAETDWRRILHLYDHLHARGKNPIVALNRAVAQAEVEGPEAALRSLDRLTPEPALQTYYPHHATRGWLLEKLNRHQEAADSYQTALTQATSAPIRRHLLKCLNRARTSQT